MIHKLRVYLLFCLGSCLFIQSTLMAQNACSYLVENNETVIDGAQFLPGDTICIAAGNRDYLYFSDIEGSPAQPIVIINRGKVIIDTDHYFGIKFSNCRYFVLSGNGSASDYYGLQIKRVGNGAGITIDNLSSDAEVAYVEVSNTAIGGIYAKTDPDCSFVATREKFTLYNLEIHHCFLHDIEDEGFYVGSSKYTGQHLSDCDTIVLPHLLHGVKIYNNLIEHTGWDGLQVSSSPVDCEIYNNIILNDSYRQTPNQMSGILIGGGSNCDCYNNTIIDGKGDGIDVFGFGNMRIFNNLIVRAGNSFHPNDPNFPRHAIFIGNAPDSAFANLKIIHNTIVQPKTTGIRYFNQFTQTNLFANNIIAEPLSYALYGAQSYINLQLDQSLFVQQSNLMVQDVQSVGFINIQEDLYDLKPDSPAVNEAAALGSNEISFDIMLRGRPFHLISDQGAFECHDPYAAIANVSHKEKDIRIYPNPASDLLIIESKNAFNGRIDVQITDLAGKAVFKRRYYAQSAHQLLVQLSEISFESGLYLLTVNTDSVVYSLKLTHTK